MPETKSKARKFLFPSLAVLLSVVITLALLEFLFWLVLHQKYPRTPGIPSKEWVILSGHGRRLRPNLDFTQWFEVSSQKVHFQTNSLGFRGREISREKPAGTTRILVLGDSITLSAFLPEQEVYPGRVEKILGAARPVEVINGGVYDTGTQEQLFLLKETGLKIHPDLVLLGFYLNDSRPPWGFENEYYRLPPRLTEISKTLEQYSYLYKWVWKRFLVSHFLGQKAPLRLDWTREYLETDWRTDRAAFKRLIEKANMDFGAAWQEDSWKKVFSDLDQFRDLASKNHFQMAIVIFPVALQVQSEVADDYPQQKIKQYCASQNLPCLDLLPILRQHKDENIYFDHCHLTALGHQVISHPIADFLKPML